MFRQNKKTAKIHKIHRIISHNDVCRYLDNNAADGVSVYLNKLNTRGTAQISEVVKGLRMKFSVDFCCFCWS